jgi:hypothetical protein
MQCQPRSGGLQEVKVYENRCHQPCPHVIVSIIVLVELQTDNPSRCRQKVLSLLLLHECIYQNSHLIHWNATDFLGSNIHDFTSIHRQGSTFVFNILPCLEGDCSFPGYCK